ncbi:tail fiber assembly protein [Escherichia coli]|uniref:tail fiber assembly protein n=1 Tax=Escherichia coli TaxID=562 RepID=UPI000BDF2C03|nr:tail fiber assembly protein [Escherichia coli]EHX2159159.1 tail fiber assembly protein [Escherichia coli]
MAKATLNKNGIATKAGDITVYNYAGDTGEYLSESVEYLSVGVGIPADSCTDAPPAKKSGFAVCRNVDTNVWEYVEDHRGETVYETATGQPVRITDPGNYADSVTTIAPTTSYDRWNGSEWVTDENAQKRAQVLAAEQKKSTLLAEAQSTISLWQTALQLGIISDEDKASLIAWVKYIQALNAVDTATAPDIEWPVKPE